MGILVTIIFHVIFINLWQRLKGQTLPQFTPTDSNLTKIFESYKTTGVDVSLNSSNFYFIDGSITIEPKNSFTFRSNYAKALTIIIKDLTSFLISDSSSLQFINLNFYKEKSADLSSIRNSFFRLMTGAQLLLEKSDISSLAGNNKNFPLITSSNSIIVMKTIILSKLDQFMDQIVYASDSKVTINGILMQGNNIQANSDIVSALFEFINCVTEITFLDIGKSTFSELGLISITGKADISTTLKEVYIRGSVCKGEKSIKPLILIDSVTPSISNFLFENNENIVSPGLQILNIPNTFTLFNMTCVNNRIGQCVALQNMKKLLTVQNVTCDQNKPLLNLLGAPYYGGLCLSLNQVRYISMNFIKVMNTYSYDVPAGILLLQEELTDNSTSPNFQITNSDFLMNKADLFSSLFVSTSIFADFVGILSIISCKFLYNLYNVVGLVDNFGSTTLTIYTLKAIVVVDNSEFSHNQASGGSNGLITSVYRANVTKSKFINNTCVGWCVSLQGACILKGLYANVFDTLFISNGGWDGTLIAFYDPAAISEQYVYVKGVKFIDNSNFLFGAFRVSGTINYRIILVEETFWTGNSALFAASVDLFYPADTLLHSYKFLRCNWTKNFGIVQAGGLGLFLFGDNIYINIEDSYFNGNSALYGGAILAWLTKGINYLILKNNIFIENVGKLIGGVIVTQFGTIKTTNDTYIDSTGNVGAGVIYMSQSSECEIKDGKFIGATAQKGGVFYASDYSSFTGSGLYIENITATHGGIFFLSYSSFVNISGLNAIRCFAEYGSIMQITDSGDLVSYLKNVVISRISATYSLLQVRSSKLDIKNLEVSSASSFIFELLSSNLRIQKADFTDVQCKELQDGCLFNLKEDSSAYLDSITSINVLNGKTGALYVLESSIEIQGFSAKNTSGLEYGTFLYGEKGEISINGLILENILIDALYFTDSSVKLNDLELSNVRIVDELATHSMLYFTGSCKYLQITNCFFHNLRSTSNGTAIKVEKAISETPIIITNCRFTSTETNDHGGAISLVDTEISIANNLFQQNHALKHGGAIIISTSKTVNLSNNNFTLCSSQLGGGAIFWEGVSQPLGLNTNKFKDNYASFGANQASIPTKLLYTYKNSTNSTKSDLSDFPFIPNAKPGFKLPKIIEFFMIDVHGNQIRNISNAQLKVTILGKPESDSILNEFSKLKGMIADAINSTDNTTVKTGVRAVYGSTFIAIAEEKFLLDNLFVIGPTNSLSFLKITTPAIRAESSLTDLGAEGNWTPHFIRNSEYSFIIPVYVTDCSPGEFYNNATYTCQRCPIGTYSLVLNSKACLPCPANVRCMGGDDLILAEGYWRSSLDSDRIYKCKNYGTACLGGKDSKCNENYYGRLCSLCLDRDDKIYERNQFQACSLCWPIGLQMLWTFFLYLILIAFGFILFRFFLRTEKEAMKNQLLLKMLINHFQLLFLLPKSNFDLSESNQNVNMLQGFLGHITKNWISTDCLIKSITDDTNKLFLLGILLRNVGFLVYLVLTLTLWGFYCKLKGRFSYKKTLLPVIIIVFYIFQPSLFTTTLSVFECVEMDGKKYSKELLSYECWTRDHSLLSMILFLPIITMYTLGFTIFVMLLVQFKRKEYNLSILIVGFKLDKFRYEFINFAKKYVVIFFSVFISDNNIHKPLSILIILGIFLYICFLHSPYYSSSLAFIDLCSLVVVFCSYYALSCQYFLDDAGLKQALFSLSLVFNLAFFTLWILSWFSEWIVKKTYFGSPKSSINAISKFFQSMNTQHLEMQKTKSIKKSLRQSSKVTSKLSEDDSNVVYVKGNPKLSSLRSQEKSDKDDTQKGKLVQKKI